MTAQTQATQTKLGHALLKSLITMREQKGEVNIEDLGSMLEIMASSLHPSPSTTDQFVRREIEKMATYISSAKSEIISLGQPSNGIPVSDATVQLDAVIKATEEAADIIMDATDTIQASVQGVGGPAEIAIMDAATRIYEACNFQDLTGQRIRKVLGMLTHIEERISRLSSFFTSEENLIAETEQKIAEDEGLLNGPQLPNAAPTQDDIDALFNSIKT